MTYAPSADEVHRLGAFLAARDLTGPEVTLTPIGDGHANLTYLASDRRETSRRVIVRRPPPPPLPPGGNDVLREASFLTAVGRAGGAPVPRVLATADAGEVFDVPFFAMTFVPGSIVTTSAPAPLASPDAARALSFALVDALAALHSIDWTTTGLRGRPEGSNLRQRDRLARLIADDAGRPPAGFADVEAWLVTHAPVESAAAIVHGDFRLGNLLVDPAAARVEAVLDWELATVADPLVDLGYLLASWASPGEALTPIQELGAATAQPGFATRDELAARYFEVRNVGAQDPTWYVALADWKLAVLYEHSRRRFEAGSGDPYYAGTAKVSALLDAARRAAGL